LYVKSDVLDVPSDTVDVKSDVLDVPSDTVDVACDAIDLQVKWLM
jgi:hypothetical protein